MDKNCVFIQEAEKATARIRGFDKHYVVIPYKGYDIRIHTEMQHRGIRRDVLEEPTMTVRTSVDSYISSDVTRNIFTEAPVVATMTNILRATAWIDQQPTFGIHPG